MKQLFYFLLIPIIGFSQANTEIYLFDLQKNDGNWTINNGKNISKNKGYDSQPSFYDNNTVLFASSRNGQTDIAKYDSKSGKKVYINNTANGGEYSPEKIPNSKNVSAVRLDKSGLQRFYEYNFNTGKDKEIIKDLVVAYPRWYDKNTVMAVSIVNDSLLALYNVNVKNRTKKLVAKNVGRSVHKIPNSNLVSFISKEDPKNWMIKSFNPKTLEIKNIIKSYDYEDICWLPNGTLLLAGKGALMKYNPTTDKKWSVFHQFNDENLINISRIMTNKNGTKLALVAEVSPRALAQEQVEGYNKRDIDAFLKPYAKNVKVYTFPNKLSYEGIDEMRKRYTDQFARIPDLHCKITSRIVQGNTVIDEELVTANGKQFKAVAIYEMKYGKIVSVRFVR